MHVGSTDRVSTIGTDCPIDQSKMWRDGSDARSVGVDIHASKNRVSGADDTDLSDGPDTSLSAQRGGEHGDNTLVAYYINLGGTKLEAELLHEFERLHEANGRKPIGAADIEARISGKVADAGRITPVEIDTLRFALDHYNVSEAGERAIDKVVDALLGKPAFSWRRATNALQAQLDARRTHTPGPLSRNLVRGIELGHFQNAALQLARRRMDNPQIQRVEIINLARQPAFLFALQNDKGESLLVRLDSRKRKIWGTDLIKSDDGKPHFASVNSVVGLPVTLGMAYQKAFAALPNAKWNASSIAIGDHGQLEYHFWHVRNWAKQPGVTVDATTAKVTINDYAAELAKAAAARAAA
jgi:hypothetical protein